MHAYVFITVPSERQKEVRETVGHSSETQRDSGTVPRISEAGTGILSVIQEREMDYEA